MTPGEAIGQLQARIGEDIIGQERIVERLIIALLANGNILVEGLPGLAKTRAVKSLSRHLEAEFSRIQFTPDLLPADITGSDVLVGDDAGQPRFRFEPGPIFANLVLADEINRAPAKVQAALLEAMEERQVTVAGTTHPMPPLFMVMATQNPIEQEGTYPLPEAQLDRFLLHVYIGYPDADAEARIIRLVRGEERAGAAAEVTEIPQRLLFEAREQVRAVQVGEVVERYMVDLIFATRYPDRYDAGLARWIQVGASPRGGLGLDRCARARAWLHGRDHVLPEDVRDVAPDVLRHRLVASYEADADGASNDDLVRKVLELVAVAA